MVVADLGSAFINLLLLIGIIVTVLIVAVGLFGDQLGGLIPWLMSVPDRLHDQYMSQPYMSQEQIERDREETLQELDRIADETMADIRRMGRRARHEAAEKRPLDPANRAITARDNQTGVDNA